MIHLKILLILFRKLDLFILISYLLNYKKKLICTTLNLNKVSRFNLVLAINVIYLLSSVLLSMVVPMVLSHTFFIPYSYSYNQLRIQSFVSWGKGGRSKFINIVIQ